MRRRNRRKDSKTSPWKIPAAILSTGLAVSIIPIAAIILSRIGQCRHIGETRHPGQRQGVGETRHPGQSQGMGETKHPSQTPTSQDPNENWITAGLTITTMATVFEAAVIAGYLTILSSADDLTSLRKDKMLVYLLYIAGGVTVLISSVPYIRTISFGQGTLFRPDPQNRRKCAELAAKAFLWQVAIVFIAAVMIAIAIMF